MITTLIIQHFLGLICHIIEVINACRYGTQTKWFALGLGSTWWNPEWVHLSWHMLTLWEPWLQDILCRVGGGWRVKGLLDLHTRILRFWIFLLGSKFILTLESNISLDRKIGRLGCPRFFHATLQFLWLRRWRQSWVAGAFHFNYNINNDLVLMTNIIWMTLLHFIVPNQTRH